MWNYEILKNLKIYYLKSKAQKKNILESADMSVLFFRLAVLVFACAKAYTVFLNFALGQDLYNLERKEASVLSLES